METDQPHSCCIDLENKDMSSCSYYMTSHHVAMFTCGSCQNEFDTICKLHKHLHIHEMGGSYQYNHSSRTAFPKYDSSCKGTQTYYNQSNNDNTAREKVQNSSSNASNFDIENSINFHNFCGFTNVEEHTNIIDSISLNKMHQADMYSEPSKAINDTKSPFDNIGMSTEENCAGMNIDTVDQFVELTNLVTKDSAEKMDEILTANCLFIDENCTRNVDSSKTNEEKNLEQKDGKISAPTHEDLEESHTKKTGQACKICGKMFRNRSRLVGHIKLSHNQARLHNLTKSRESTRSNEPARSHDLDQVNSHDSDKPHNPSRSHNPSRTRDPVRSHNPSRTHDLQYPRGQCEYCGKTFTKSYHIQEHIKYCLNIRPYKCDYCEKRFIRGTALRNHVSVHTGDKPYVCDECGASLGSISSLQKHKHAHTGQRKYNCDQCGQTFITKESLKDHLRIHSQEKRYTCTYCEKSFIKKCNMKTHVRQHTGEAPYKCDVCGVGFKQNVLLRTHKQRHIQV